MAVIVEDGSLVSGANSYIDSSYLTTYASDRGITITGDADELIFQSMTYVDSLPFIGEKRTKEQTTQWPRDYVVIDGWDVLNNEIPAELTKLQAEVALSIDSGVDPLSTVDRKISSASVGSLSVSYSDDSAPFAYSRTISALERKLVGGGLGALKRW